MPYQGPWTTGRQGSADNLNAAMLQKDTNSNRPAAAQAGIAFYDTTYNKLSRDTGAAWEDLSPVQSKVKTADETVNNSATLQDDDHITGLNVEANTRYILKGYFFFNSGATPDFKFRIVLVTATGIIDYTAVDFTAGGVPLQHGDESTDIVIAGQAADRGFPVEGVAQITGTAGTIKLQWAQNTADASDTKLLAGSYLYLIKL